MGNSNVIEMVTQNNSEDEFFVDSLCVGNISTNDNLAWYSVAIVNDSKLKIKLNTGSSANEVSWKTFKLKNSPPLQPTNVCLRAYGDHIANHKIKTNLICKINNLEEVLEFYFAMTKAPPY